MSDKSDGDSPEERTLAHFDKCPSRQDINNRIPSSVLVSRIGRWPDFSFLFLSKAKLYSSSRAVGRDLCWAEVVSCGRWSGGMLRTRGHVFHYSGGKWPPIQNYGSNLVVLLVLTPIWNFEVSIGVAKVLKYRAEAD